MSKSPRALSAVFFDLDGTLVDTAPDIASSLNQLLGNHDRPPLPFRQIRSTVSLGSDALLYLGFAIDEHSSEIQTLRDEFLEIYTQRLHQDSHLFPGMSELLARIETMGMSWGIITNKPTTLTESLMGRLGLNQRCHCVVCGDSTPYKKPHPAPMFHACELIGSPPENCVYIGDAQRDIDAGRASGMQTLAAAYGYIGQNDHVERWQASAIVQSTKDILSWIQKENGSLPHSAGGNNRNTLSRRN